MITNGSRQRVVVFGGSGFLGSHVADALTQSGYEVTIFDLVPSPHLKPEQKMVVGNILDQKEVENVIKGAKYVYNFAAVAEIAEAANDPLKTIQYNIWASSLIANACKDFKVERLLYGSTIYVFSNLGSFYKASKLSAEAILEAFQEKFGLNFTILRYGSLYGPRAQNWNSVRNYITQALSKSEIDLSGTGDERREYIHVFDAAALSVSALNPEFKNERITITGSQSLRSRDLVQMISEIVKKPLTIKASKTLDPDHYFITPYNFSPKLGTKLTSQRFVDIGQGILQLMEEIYQEKHL